MSTLRTRRYPNKKGENVEYIYDTIKGQSVKEYFRSKARERYVPKPKLVSTLDEEGTQLVCQLSKRGVSQVKIARILNVTRHLVRKIIKNNSK